MDFSDIVSISGLSGLYKVVTRRQDGCIISGLNDDDKKFLSSRIHVFSTLDNITIYTDDDSVQLEKVMKEMLKKKQEHPPVDVKASSDELKEYFEKVLPDYDKEKVYVSDIKKVIKWFHLLDEHSLIIEEKKEAGKKEQKTVAKEKENKEKKPKASAKKAKAPATPTAKEG